MAKIEWLKRFASGLLILLLATPSFAADRTLLRIESASPNGVRHRVLDVSGPQRAEPPAAFPTWTLTPGDAVRGDIRPPDRVVELYSGTREAPSLLCRIVLRYYPSASGWMPQLRLEEEPVVAPVGGRWQPLALAGGLAGALVRHGNALPNAEGFFPALEFGLSAGSLSIVAWQVR